MCSYTKTYTIIKTYLSGRVSTSQSKGWEFDPQPLSELP